MRVAVVTKDYTDYSRTVTEWLREMERQTGHTPELIDPDSRDGASFCRVYDIVQYPCVIAMSDDGQMQQMWPGVPLPTISEVSFYYA